MKRFALFTVAALAALTGHARFALANPGTLGYSGKPYNGVSETCSKANCHTGGNAPTLTLTAPQSMQAGSQAEFTVTVAGNSQGTSFNAAVPSGMTVANGQNTTVPTANKDAEISAITPPPAGGTGTYKFRVTAPPTNGTFMLWVAGMATNRDGSKAGDGVATATRTITVTGGAPPGSDAGTRTDGGVVVTPPGTDGGQGEEPGTDGPGGGGADGGKGNNGSGRGPNKGAGNGDPENDDSSLGQGAAGCSMASGNAGGALLTLSGGGMLAIASIVRRRRQGQRRTNNP